MSARHPIPRTTIDADPSPTLISQRLRRAARRPRWRPGHAHPSIRRRLRRRVLRRAPIESPLTAISGRLFDADGRDRTVDVSQHVVKSLKQRQLLWVDIDTTGTHDLDDVAEQLGIERDDLVPSEDDDQRPRMHRSEDRLVLALDALEAGEGRSPVFVRHQVRLLAGKNLVVSVHEGPIGALDRYTAELAGETRLGALTSADLLSSLTDEIIAGYFRVAEAIEREIDALDQRALRGTPGDDVLAGIVAVRRRIGLVRRTLTRNRDALSSLGRPEMRVEEIIGQPWTGLGDRLERAIDAVEVLRESLLGTYDIQMGRAAQRANDTMKTLTLLSAVLLPAVVLAGVMGMNFKLAFFDDPSNMFVVIGAMIALAVGILAVGRWRHWL